MGNCHSFTEFFRLKFGGGGGKGTLLGLENEHCIKMISVDANGSVTNVTGGLNSTINHGYFSCVLPF